MQVLIVVAFPALIDIGCMVVHGVWPFHSLSSNRTGPGAFGCGRKFTRGVARQSRATLFDASCIAKGGGWVSRRP